MPLLPASWPGQVSLAALVPFLIFFALFFNSNRWVFALAAGLFALVVLAAGVEAFAMAHERALSMLAAKAVAAGGMVLVFRQLVWPK